MQEHSNSTRLKHLAVQSEKLVSRKPEEPSYQVVRNVLKWTLWKTFSCLVFYVAFDPVSRFSGRPVCCLLSPWSIWCETMSPLTNVETRAWLWKLWPSPKCTTTTWIGKWSTVCTFFKAELLHVYFINFFNVRFWISHFCPFLQHQGM